MGPDPEEDGTDSASGVPVFWPGLGIRDWGFVKAALRVMHFPAAEALSPRRIYPITVTEALKDV
ncbi:hypothetical protein [Xanthomonas phaseoli]|nr:hypothetical protein [Xanthomonas phaseoli]